MPPPTRMNIARRAAPKPKPEDPWGRVSEEDDDGGAEQAESTVAMPTTPPVRKATFIPSSRFRLRAALGDPDKPWPDGQAIPR